MADRNLKPMGHPQSEVPQCELGRVNEAVCNIAGHLNKSVVKVHRERTSLRAHPEVRLAGI